MGGWGWGRPLRKLRIGRAFLCLIGDIFIKKQRTKNKNKNTHVIVTMKRLRQKYTRASWTGRLRSSSVKFSLLEKAPGPIVLIKVPAGHCPLEQELMK